MKCQITNCKSQATTYLQGRQYCQKHFWELKGRAGHYKRKVKPYLEEIGKC